jgi:hypothetical protein
MAEFRARGGCLAVVDHPRGQKPGEPNKERIIDE